MLRLVNHLDESLDLVSVTDPYFDCPVKIFKFFSGFDISHGKSAQMVQEIIELEILIRMQVFWGICSIRKGGVHLSKQGNFKD